MIDYYARDARELSLDVKQTQRADLGPLAIHQKENAFTKMQILGINLDFILDML